jgi:hypothetical protein
MTGDKAELKRAYDRAKKDFEALCDNHIRQLKSIHNRPDIRPSSEYLSGGCAAIQNLKDDIKYLSLE